MMRQADKDGDGLVSFDEFKEIMTSKKKAIWYIVKILDSETRRSTSTAYLNKHCTTKDSILIEKSKLINYNTFYEIDKKTLDNFEGLELSQYVIMVAKSSPYLLAIFNQYHKNQLNHDASIAATHRRNRASHR